MLRLSLAVLMLGCSLSSFAMVSSIKEIVLADESSNDDHLILMNSGHVLFVAKNRPSELKKYQKYFKANQSFSFAEPSERKKTQSVMTAPERIQAEFDLMNPNWKSEGQCHDKAHVWVYEANKRGVSMNKIFLFFTKDYIRKYRFGWWFHVAPIMKEGKDIFMMDSVFLDSPSTVKEWTDIFMENSATCSKIKYYSTYEQNKWKKDCYLIETSKFIRQPSHIKNKSQRNVFYTQEVRNAYKRAFYQEE